RAHRGRLRCRSRRVGSRRRVDRRSVEVAAAPQADAVRRPHAARPRQGYVRARRPRVARRSARARRDRPVDMTSPFQDLIDLASERFGAAVIAANDEFFAPKESLIKPSPAQWIEGKYTDRGKWMDGWETRRRRDDGTHDWCVIRLGARGIVRGVDVETTHFKGNYPEACTIEAGDGEGWVEILPRACLHGDTQYP